MTSVALPETGGSPFDQIMELDTDSTPVWRARHLMALMGYPRWSDFQRVLTRAMTAAKNTEMIVNEVFRASTENPGEKGGRPREDFKLTRDAAYLTALNGDPNKEEVAGAQRYFVEQTKRQEAADRSTAAQAPVAIAAQSEIERAAVARAQIEMLGAAVSTGLLDKLWATSKTHVIAARVIGEAPELPAEMVPLYVPDFLKLKGLTARDINSVQSWFGRRAVEMGEANGIDVPELRPTEQPNGSIRETRAWRREHLPLFEMVWDTYYAEKYATPMFLELGAA